MEYLFIGGHQDGKLHNVNGISVRFPVMPSPCEAAHVSQTDTSPKPVFEIEVYWRSKLRGNAKYFYVFTLEGMSGDSIIEALLKNYSRHSIDEFHFAR